MSSFQLLPEDKGTNTQGGKYNSIADLWEHELGDDHKDPTTLSSSSSSSSTTWYTKASM
jgi:hypothetical protein